jgi:hypothetical protein
MPDPVMAAANLMPLLAYGAALALTLSLAAWCTPRAWWRRPNVRALAVVGAGTAGFGMLFSMLLVPAAAPAAAVRAAAPDALSAPAAAPIPGTRYRVVDHLNLRQTHGVRATRLVVLPAGTVVATTGEVDGDWWQVRARVDGHAVEGWASSLWLRRADEGRAVR